MTAGPHIVVLTATRNRPQLLRERALAWVLAQTLSPTSILVVDDRSAPPASSLLEGIDVTVVTNERRDGASGAWNTGLYVAAHCFEPGHTFVAMLDDDDAWHPAYLATCLETVLETDADVVASRLRWMISPGTLEGIVGPPDRLVVDDFLVGSPGLQGVRRHLKLTPRRHEN